MKRKRMRKTGWITTERTDPNTRRKRPIKVFYRNGKEVKRVWLDKGQVKTPTPLQKGKQCLFITKEGRCGNTTLNPNQLCYLHEIIDELNIDGKKYQVIKYDKENMDSLKDDNVYFRIFDKNTPPFENSIEKIDVIFPDQDPTDDDVYEYIRDQPYTYIEGDDHIEAEGVNALSDPEDVKYFGTKNDYIVAFEGDYQGRNLYGDGLVVKPKKILQIAKIVD